MFTTCFEYCTLNLFLVFFLFCLSILDEINEYIQLLYRVCTLTMSPSGVRCFYRRGAEVPTGIECVAVAEHWVEKCRHIAGQYTIKKCYFPIISNAN